MASHLKQRGHSWYVQYAVPRGLQSTVGCKVITRALKTRDIAVAERLKFAVLADIQRELAEAVGASLGSPEALLEYAKLERERINAGEVEERGAEDGFMGATEKLLERAAKVHGVDSEGHPKMSPEDVATVRRAQAAMSGELSRSLGVQVEAFLQSESDHLTAAHVSEKRRWLQLFAEWYGEDRPSDAVTRAELGAYERDVIQKRTRANGDKTARVSIKTRRKEAGAIRTFFDWLEGVGIIDESPALRLGLTLKETTRGVERTRRPWENHEIETVLRGVPQSGHMFSAFAIAAYTGMRVEEVATLRIRDVRDGVFLVRKGKTKAAIRRMPVHPVLRGLVDSLVTTSSDGYLISGLLFQTDDLKRGKGLSSRFSETDRVNLGLHDRSILLHTLRNSVTTQMQRGGIDEKIIKQWMGHTQGGVTFDVYSAGVTDEQLAASNAGVSYGEAVDTLVRNSRPVITEVSVSRKKQKA